MAEGWFKLPGRTGERTLKEQMRGLDRAVEQASGKTVLDLGCAEGLIAMQFVRAGAVRVRAIDCNEAVLRAGRQFLEANEAEGFPARLAMEQGNLNAMLVPGWEGTYDIVLALAILHKMKNPEQALRATAGACLDLLVLRLGGGSRGEIRSKFWPHVEVDSWEILPGLGFEFDGREQGPRNEQVHYWRRRC
jgi:SAM-dependent methyltransferase